MTKSTKHEDKLNGNSDSLKRCICGKKVQFTSTRLCAGFCSDGCYEQAQRGTNPEAAHIVLTRKQGAYFEQGDVKVSIDAKNLEKTLGAGPFKTDGSCLDHLMDSQLVALASLNGLPVSPFVRELLLSPLRGIVQLVWYRDLKKHKSDHLTKGQLNRIAEYKRKLVNYVPSEGSDKPTRGKRLAARSQALTGTYRAIAKAKSIPSGRAQQLYDVLKGFKTATFPQIVTAAEGKVKTTQGLEKIVKRFIGVLLSAKAIEEMKA